MSALAELAGQAPVAISPSALGLRFSARAAQFLGDCQSRSDFPKELDSKEAGWMAPSALREKRGLTTCFERESVHVAVTT